MKAARMPVPASGVTVTITPEVACQKVGEEIVLLHLETGIYYGLDPVGARVWELLVLSGTLQNVLEVLETEYEVDAGTLERDVTRLLEELLTQGLVRRSGG